MTWRTRKAQHRDEALLVAVAERLCAEAALVDLRTEFRASLRSTLLAEAPSITPPVPSHVIGRTSRPKHRVRTGRRRMAVATAVVLSSLGLAGMVTASASALPGETLYPVKRAAEHTEMGFHRAAADRGRFHLELANRRLDEARQLLDRGPAYTDLGVVALEEFDDEAKNGSDDLVNAYRAENSKDSIVALNRFSARAMRQLNSMQAKFVDLSLPQVDQARQRLSSIAAMTARLCPDCSGTRTTSALSTPARATTPKPTERDAPPSPSVVPLETGVTAGRLVKTTNRHHRDNDTSDDKSDDIDTAASAVVETPTPAVQKPVSPPVGLSVDDDLSGNPLADLVDGLDDVIDIPSLNGQGELLNLDQDDN